MFNGTGTALVTPFNEEYEIDFQALRNLLEDQINGSVDAIIILGTTGESPVINEEERRKIIDECVSIVNGRAKVVVGTGTNDTKKVIKYNLIAEKYKADGLLIVNPYYNKTTQRGLAEHYRYISERTDLPIILYNVPSRTAMNMLPETILQIHTDCKNVVGVKEASGDISQIARLCALKPDTLAVLSGNDDQTLPVMALGGKGVISVFSNIFPKQMKELTDTMLKGNQSHALQLHNKYLKMMNLLFAETSPIPVKYLCSLRGLCKNYIRLPLVNISNDISSMLEEEYERLTERI